MVNLGKRLTIQTSQRGSVALFSVNGRMLFEKKVRSGVTKLTLPQASGFYVVRLRMGNTTVSEKILIQ